MNALMASIADELERTGRVQLQASDPAASVWVSANAGTGKTHVLKMRVLRLLLSGVAPQKILCLTYTKAAASEMSKRVFDDLARWVTLSEVALQADLFKLLSRAPTADERRPGADALYGFDRNAGRLQGSDDPCLRGAAAAAISAGSGRDAGICDPR